MSNLEKCVPPDNAANSSSTTGRSGKTGFAGCYLLVPANSDCAILSGDGYNWGCPFGVFYRLNDAQGLQAFYSFLTFLSMQKGLCRV